MRETLTDRIASDLRGLITSGKPLPMRLTLPQLSRHYEVSPTPIRQAIDQLCREGYLRKNRAGRVSAVAEMIGTSQTRTAPDAASNNEWKQDLIRSIVTSSLAGESVFLREEATASRFDTGRTVIRQTFSHLAGQGLLLHLPRRGWQVRTFDADDLASYLSVREIMELEALEESRASLDPGRLREMLELNSGSDKSGRPQLDNSLHQYIIEQSGNRYIAEFFGRYGLYYKSLFEFAAPETRLVREMASQHRAILEAIIARRWAVARKALAAHIRDQQPVVHQLMERMVGNHAH